jgi:serine protease AprX
MHAPGLTWGDAKRRRATLAVAAVAALSVQTTAHTSATGVRHYIVQALPGQLGVAMASVRDTGGAVLEQLGVINGFTASIADDRVSSVATQPGVRAVTPDAAVTLQGAAYDPVFEAGAPQAVAQAVGADMYWQNGYFGQGVGVALIDSGVVPVDGLRKVYYGPDLSPEGADTSLRNLDTFGHGTFMGSLIAGRTGNAARPYLGNYASTFYVGVAPEANLVSVKVADSVGNTQQSAIIKGIDWVLQHRNDNGYNIKVINLSLGSTNTTGYLNDPVSAAAERAWSAGILVVTAGGNNGVPGLLLPAADPWLVAAGALDNKSTVSISDDVVASFSNTGNSSRTPDFVADATHIVGLRDPGSYIDTTYGGSGAASAQFFRGSGTSQAAALTSGAAAVLYSYYRNATPDQIKALLMQCARKLAGLTTTNAGQGGLYIAGAFGHALPASTQNFSHAANWSTSSTSWSGGSWSGNAWAGAGAPAPTASSTGAKWTGALWTGAKWTGSVWTGSVWTGAKWTDASWS